MNNLIRLLLILIYPVILFASLTVIFRKYKSTIKDKYGNILFNTVIATIAVAIGLIIFFHFENTIYAYDYAGHWIRALTLRKYFYECPKEILTLVYNSMNYSDYSYLPALFGLPFIVINQSYLFFALTNLLIFLVPSFLIIQLIYYKYINKKAFTPLVVLLAIYPLYLTLFYGKVDCSGLAFVLMGYALIIMPEFDDVDYIDTLSINMFAFIAIFLRRWYLYTIICLYISFFVKWLFHKNKNYKDFFKMLSSGIVLLAITLLFFKPFILNSLTNNFDEAYAFYNRDGKLLSFINNISPLVCIVSFIGCIYLYKHRNCILLVNVLSIVIPCLMVWKIQSFEYHHYYILLTNIIILFMYGFDFLSDKKMIISLLAVLLLIQPLIIFTNIGKTYIFTDIRKKPEILDNKDKLIELSQYIKSVEIDDSYTAFLCAGSYGIITDDLIRNSLLPDIDFPNIDSAVFDIRDGFPKDFEFIKYIITVDPIIYTDKEFQHMFDIIDDAIKNNVEISAIYSPIYSMKIDDIHNVVIYERIGEYTQEMKKHFYNEMLKCYPDKTDYFAYILD